METIKKELNKTRDLVYTTKKDINKSVFLMDELLEHYFFNTCEQDIILDYEYHYNRIHKLVYNYIVAIYDYLEVAEHNMQKLDKQLKGIQLYNKDINKKDNEDIEKVLKEMLKTLADDELLKERQAHLKTI